MLFELPDREILYGALLARDPAYEGRAYVGVSSTGVFCRLTCPARNPKPENCRFFSSIAECLEAGFRPCKRCHPLGPAAEADVAVQTLLKALESKPARRWGEDDIVRLGFDPSSVRRSFKRHFGMTFLDMARRARLRNGVETLSNGGRVIDAQLDARFSSPSAFRAAFAKLLGAAPGNFAKDALLKADWIETPLGAIVAVSDKSALHLLEFADRKALPNELKRLQTQVRGALGFGRTAPTEQVAAELKVFFEGKGAGFNVPLALHGSAFTREVWRALREIPAGETCSYSEIARRIGRPAAVRAVARANGANQIAIVIPCHRVIGADGSLTGYGGGLWRKQKLIELERRIAAQKVG
jgi:AraC family transcriptional regulator of adaptative response/methylated-DNA-[protein]-cysteine methyltransferase